MAAILFLCPKPVFPGLARKDEGHRSAHPFPPTLIPLCVLLSSGFVC
jgi:hypothetical protein